MATVSVSVSFSPVYGRSGAIRSRLHVSGQPPMNPDERSRTTCTTPPTQLEACSQCREHFRGTGAVSPGLYGPAMAERPTTSWRHGIAEEAEELAAGTLDPECACMEALFPEELLTATDAVLDAFEGELPGLGEVSDERVLGVVERVVVALNGVNDARNGSAFETGEREKLCDYIDASLAERGVDVAGLTARHGLGRYELTDKWRTW